MPTSEPVPIIGRLFELSEITDRTDLELGRKDEELNSVGLFAFRLRHPLCRDNNRVNVGAKNIER